MWHEVYSIFFIIIYIYIYIEYTTVLYTCTIYLVLYNMDNRIKLDPLFSFSLSINYEMIDSVITFIIDEEILDTDFTPAYAHVGKLASCDFLFAK